MKKVSSKHHCTSPLSLPSITNWSNSHGLTHNNGQNVVGVFTIHWKLSHGSLKLEKIADKNAPGEGYITVVFSDDNVGKISRQRSEKKLILK